VNVHSWEQVALPQAQASSHPKALVRAVLLIIPAIVAALFWLSGRTTMAIVVVAIAGAMTLLAIVSPPASFAVNRALTLLGATLAKILMSVVLALLYAFVFTPAAIITRLRGIDPLERRADPHIATYWNVVARHPRLSLLERQYAYERTQAQLGGRRAIVPRLITAGLVLVVVNYAIGFAISSSTSESAGEAADWQAQGNRWAKFYLDEPWVKQLVPDHFKCLALDRIRVRGYVGFTMIDCATPTVNITNATRKSAQGPHADDPAAAEVWFFGGSTTFGFGTRDDDTYPSHFSILADKRGMPVKVVNFGLPAYISWQEGQRLEQRLASGSKPDLVVFYDGYNDLLRHYSGDDHDDDFAGVYDGVINEIVAKSHDALGPLRESSAVHYLYRRLTETPFAPSPDGPENIETRAQATARQYTQTQRHIQRVARSYDVPVFAFWQPIRPLQNPANLSALEREPEEHDSVLWPHMRETYTRATELVASAGVARILREVTGNKRPIWLDECHLTPEGNDLIAAAMLDELGARLREIIEVKRARIATPPPVPSP
jgi:lysophospholipase L1-like esterase